MVSTTIEKDKITDETDIKKENPSDLNDIEDINFNDDAETTSVTEKSNNSEEINNSKENKEKDILKIAEPKPIKLDDVELEPKAKKEDKSEEESCPPLPTRRSTEPVNAQENPILKQLKEAFPNIDEKYVKAVIIASSGALDPAFNALLYLSDPESGKDIELPTRPTVAPLPPRKSQTQLEQDELLARQLNEQYNKQHHRRSHLQHSRPVREEFEDEAAYEARIRDRERRRRNPLSKEERTEIYGEENEDSWSQFVAKDLPDLATEANKSIQETANKISTWFSGVAKNYKNPENNDNYNDINYNDDQLKQQERELKYYERQKQKPERRRFNSFGAQAGEETLKSHGISLRNEDLSDDEDVPPQLPSRERSKEPSKLDENIGDTTLDEQKIVPQTTYIDTPDEKKKSKWTPPQPSLSGATPTKASATGSTLKKDDDDFLIHTDDEL